jgi:hypothetical protein
VLAARFQFDLAFADLPLDDGSIGQDKLHGSAWLDAEFLPNWFRQKRVVGADVN